jgi:hypothetical protein
MELMELYRSQRLTLWTIAVDRTHCLTGSACDCVVAGMCTAFTVQEEAWLCAVSYLQYWLCFLQTQWDPQGNNEWFLNCLYYKLEYVLSRNVSQGCGYLVKNLCKSPYTTEFLGVYNSYTVQLVVCTGINLAQKCEMCQWKNWGKLFHSLKPSKWTVVF